MHARSDDSRETALRVVDSDGAPAQEYYQAAALHAEESEIALLGLCLADAEMPPAARENVLEQVASRLKADAMVFSNPIRRAIYEAMLTVAGKGLLADVITTHAEMRRRNVPGYRFDDLYTLTTRAHNDVELDNGRIEALCQNILDAAGRRQLMAIAQHIMNHAAGGTEIAEIGERIGRAVEQVRRPTIGADTTIAAVGDAYMHQLAEWQSHPGELRGTTSGLANVDKVTHGWRRGHLIVVGGRTSMGKTTYGLHFVRAAARAIMTRETGLDHQVGVISLEMSSEELMHKLVAAEAGVDADAILRGDPSLDWDAIEEAVSSVQAMPIRIIDAHGAANRVNGQGGQMTAAHIREHALAWQREGPLDVLLVDFLGLITPSRELRRENTEQRMAASVQAMKHLAAELQIPVIALTQQNRENEGAGGVPQLHHLRDSDVIGHIADLVLFPVRWDYYRERGMPVPESVKGKPKGYTELYLQKQRGGRIGMIPLYSDMATNRIWDWSDKRHAPITPDGHIITRRNERGELEMWRPECWPTDDHETHGKGR